MKNLLYNGDFELWTYPNTCPDGWVTGGSVGSYSITRDTAIVKSGNYSLKFQTDAGTATHVSLRQNIHTALGISFWRGRTITIGGWVHASAAGLAKLYVYDGIDQSGQNSPNSAVNTWQWMKTTHTVNASATGLYFYPYFNAIGSEQTGYYDGLVALEGCWVPQTPYDFEDVEFRLGPTSATSIVLYPDEGMELGKHLMHNTQRAADGHLYGYEFGTYHKSSIPVQFMPSSDAAIVNSWWESQAKLLLFVTSGPVTAVHSCMIMGETCPMNQLNKPYDDRFKGTIPLEGY